MMYRWWYPLLLCASVLPDPVLAQKTDLPVASVSEEQNLVVDYAADYFDRYRPNTALDMVGQLPGFQLDDGEDIRGFASAVGNILINDEYTSAKQDLPSAILARIPASQVERIEIIRGEVRNIDLHGRALVANIILRENVPAAVRWDAFLEDNSAAPLKPGLSLSLTDVFAGIEYNIGMGVERDSSGRYASEKILNSQGTLTETRTEDTSESGLKISGVYLNASRWMGATLMQLNSKFNMTDSERETLNPRFKPPFTGAGELVTLVDKEKNSQFELGMDAERELTKALTGKAIMLLFRAQRQPVSTQRNFNSTAIQTQLRETTTDNQTTEAIGRFEFNWAGIKDHSVQLNAEAAYNELDGSLTQFVDKGKGPVTVAVPGANTRVEEVRGDFLLKDTWSLSVFKLDYGLGAETSKISQSGDAELERNFFFLKPQAVLGYSPNKSNQTRIRLAREVAQLDFNDFVSSVVLEDDDLALGNPNLQPDTTWIAELGHERRFGKLSVIKVTLFHHWVSDVMDLLPLTPTFEVPGNIGDGRRWGVEIENTLPLETLGLTGARLDVKLRWQDSSVVDPVTGEHRIFSGESGDGGYRTLANLSRNNKYFIRIDYRQDFEQARMAWGWTVAERAERPIYKVNELELNDENMAINTFVETTRWFDTKIRLSAENILNYTIQRNRTVFTGARDNSPVDFYANRERHIGYRFVLSLSGNF